MKATTSTHSPYDPTSNFMPNYWSPISWLAIKAVTTKYPPFLCLTVLEVVGPVFLIGLLVGSLSLVVVVATIAPGEGSMLYMSWENKFLWDSKLYGAILISIKLGCAVDLFRGTYQTSSIPRSMNFQVHKLNRIGMKLWLNRET